MDHPLPAGQSIVLFYPSVELGGAELLVARIADHLSSLGHPVTVIDSQAAIIVANLQTPGPRTLITSDGKPVRIQSDFIIAFASHVAALHRWVDPRSTGRLLFWSIHPHNLVYVPPLVGKVFLARGLQQLKRFNRVFFREQDAIRRSLIYWLLARKALVAMDGENSRSIHSYYRIAQKIPFLPIPVPNCLARAPTRRSVPTAVTIFWYGRLCDFKSPSLEYLMDRIAAHGATASAAHSKITLKIIGDGDDRADLAAHAETMRVSAQFLGTLDNAAALELMRREADVVFAMGTAALETAASGIPTIMATPSYDKIRFVWKFSWLYSTTGFDLGVFKRSDDVEGMALADLLDELTQSAEIHAQRGIDYVRDNHHIDSVCRLLISTLNGSSAHCDEFMALATTPRSLRTRLLSFLRRKFANTR